MVDSNTNVFQHRENGEDRLPASFEIEETLENIIADEYSDAVFECKLSRSIEPRVSWYKDGQAIIPSRRIKMTNNKKWYRLEIKSVTENDHGIYTVICKNNSRQVYFEGTLFIKKTVNNLNNDSVIYMRPILRKSLGVTKQLINTIVKVEDSIKMEAEFQTEVIEFRWFKNNREVLQDDRINIIYKKKSSIIHINKAETSDSGVYLVIARIKYGISSSFGNVQVLESDPLSMNNELPSIIESLPDEIECNESEEIRLTCKVEFDQQTKIQWYKNDNIINSYDSDRLVAEDYGNRYIGLRIEDICKSDTAKYSVTLRNEITGWTDSSSCFLTVNPCPMKSLPIVQLNKPLEPVVASIGSQVSFDCSFELEDSRYFFVVWYVGHFRVERTNTQFNVVSKNGEFLLYIKKLEPGMAGEVLCELRRALPNQRSILVNSTSAYISVVPHTVVKNEFSSNNNKFEPRIHREMNIKMNTIRNGVMNRDDNTFNKLSINGNSSVIARYKPNDVILGINYCRLEDGYYYLRVGGDETFTTKASTHLEVYSRLNKDTDLQHSKVVVMEWNDHDPSIWYGIELEQSNGEFIETGVSSLPMFEIRQAPIAKLMKFRIRALHHLNEANESRICITPELPEKPKKAYNLKPMEEFEPTFVKTGDLLGCGAFGSVVLVQDKDGEYFAAKILKTRTQKKRETAMREYDIMKGLRHPKLVELHEAFLSKDSFILVMDYLWGGELFDRIVEEEHIKEVDVVPYVRQICEALQYLHAHKIAHLDLKPENIICLSPNTRQVKIIDFGLARVLDEGNITRAIYGTRDYIAPEVLNFERLTLACDMWSLGVVSYMLLSGVMPFAGDSWPERSANITMANYNYDETAFKDISDLAKDFVDKLLVLAGDKRMSATTALNHKWIIEGPPKGAKAGHMKRARENLKSYLANYRARWQRAGNVMIAAHRLRNIGRGTEGADQSVRPRVT